MSATKEVHYSARRTPCPVCGRVKDGDCRWSDHWIACHSGAAACSAGIGQVITIDGRQWFLSRTNGGHSGRAYIFHPDRPQQAWHDTVEVIAKTRACRPYYDALRPRVHAALRLPHWEHCTLAEMRLVDETYGNCKALLEMVQQARCRQPELRKLLPIIRHWIKALGYQRDDLKRFQAEQLGMLEGWR